MMGAGPTAEGAIVAEVGTAPDVATAAEVGTAPDVGTAPEAGYWARCLMKAPRRTAAPTGPPPTQQAGPAMLSRAAATGCGRELAG